MGEIDWVEVWALKMLGCRIAWHMHYSLISYFFCPLCARHTQSPVLDWVKQGTRWARTPAL